MPKICVLTINVSNMEQALDFYCNQLGFDLQKQWGDCLAELKHEGLPLILNKVEYPVKVDYPHVAQSVLCFQTDDLVSAIEDLKSKGVELIYDSPQDFPHGIYVAFRDPFGNAHELLEFR